MTDKPLHTARVSIVNFDPEGIEETVRKIKKIKARKVIKKRGSKSKDKMNEDLCDVRKKAKRLKRKKKRICIKMESSKMKENEEYYEQNYFGIKSFNDQNDAVNNDSKDTFESKEEKKKIKCKKAIINRRYISPIDKIIEK